MSAADAMLCHATSRWLRACGRGAGALGLGAGFVAALALPSVSGVAACGFALVLLLALPERLLALRLAFDAGLFDDLAAGNDVPSSRLEALDNALHALQLRGAPASTRGLSERVAGARRLSRHYLAVVLAQTTLLAASLGMQWMGRAA